MKERAAREWTGPWIVLAVALAIMAGLALAEIILAGLW